MADTSKTGVAEGAFSSAEEAPNIPVVFPKASEYHYAGGVVLGVITIQPGAVVHGKPSVETPLKPLALSHHSVPRPTYQSAPPGQEYVDPYLFETGHFESREEYEELTRTAKIKPRSRA